MPLLPVAPGWARGQVHRVEDTITWSSGREAPEVTVLPALWWPPPHPLPGNSRAAILLGLPVAPSPGGPLLPTVAGADSDLLEEGEQVEVNGSKGTIAIEGVEEVRVVTAFLEREDGRILLLQRSEKVGSFRGRWAGISGYLEDPTPLDQVYREIREEVGIERKDLDLVAEGHPVLARDGSRVFVVFPFRFLVRAPEIHLDWESARAEWVDPREIRQRQTVPKLDRAWSQVGERPVPKS